MGAQVGDCKRDWLGVQFPISTESGERSTLTLGSLYLPCCVRDTDLIYLTQGSVQYRKLFILRIVCVFNIPVDVFYTDRVDPSCV